MRDIGRRIQRYRLSRYGNPVDPFTRRLRWIWLVALAWLGWIGVVSDHSFYRIWRLEHEREQVGALLVQAQTARMRMDAELKDPAARSEREEELLRIVHGMAKPDEIIYRMRQVPADSLEHP